MRVLNDHNGDMDGRVALTVGDIRLLVIALGHLIERFPNRTAKLDGDTLLAQLDAMLADHLERHTL
jgi:predicted methyltransferase